MERDGLYYMQDNIGIHFIEEILKFVYFLVVALVVKLNK